MLAATHKLLRLPSSELSPLLAVSSTPLSNDFIKEIYWRGSPSNEGISLSDNDVVGQVMRLFIIISFCLCIIQKISPGCLSFIDWALDGNGFQVCNGESNCNVWLYFCLSESLHSFGPAVCCWLASSCSPAVGNRSLTVTSPYFAVVCSELQDCTPLPLDLICLQFDYFFSLSR